MTARKRATCQLQDAKGPGGLTAHVKVSNVSPSYAVSLSYATIFAAISTSKSRRQMNSACGEWTALIRVSNVYGFLMIIAVGSLVLTTA